MTPKIKIVVASAVLLVLGGAASLSGMNSALLARIALATVSVAALAWWALSARNARGAADEKPRLNIIARTGLSNRTGLALVEVDGQPLVVVHGEGFAEIHQPGVDKRPRRRSRKPSFKQALRSVS